LTENEVRTKNVNKKYLIDQNFLKVLEGLKKRNLKYFYRDQNLIIIY